MNAQNTNKLIKDFPILYRGYTKSPEETLMCWGFECGNGWYNLLYTLSAALTNHMNENPGMDIEAVQVKEKFASLRFYIDGGDDYAMKLIEEAERQSVTICEDCGAPAKLQNRGGWFATLCPLCAFSKGFEEAPQEEENNEPENIMGDNIKCRRCGWIHFINLSKEYAAHGYKCFRCGNTGKENFVEPSEADIPRGSTIQQVNVVEPGK